MSRANNSEIPTMDTRSTASGTPDNRVLVDVREAARLLNISTRTLWTLTDCGELPSVRIGSRVLYRLETLCQFAEQRERGPHDAN